MEDLSVREITSKTQLIQYMTLQMPNPLLIKHISWSGYCDKIFLPFFLSFLLSFFEDQPIFYILLQELTAMRCHIPNYSLLLARADVASVREKIKKEILSFFFFCFCFGDMKKKMLHKSWGGGREREKKERIEKKRIEKFQCKLRIGGKERRVE